MTIPMDKSKKKKKKSISMHKSTLNGNHVITKQLIL